MVAKSDSYELIEKFQGKCYVWKINEEGLGLPRFQAVTKFQAHNKYLTRCLLSPDVKCGTIFPSSRLFI
jgi:target of rapamycin complex subunit LST8